MLAIKEEPFKDMGFAKIDTHRGIRQGVPEVIYGAGKTKEQIKEIVKYLQKSGEETVLITRMSSEAAKFVSEEIDLRYDEISKVGIIGPMPKKDGIGTIVVASAGTSDMYVAEEAALTAEVFGNQVTRLYDVGVAGLHRLISHVDEIMRRRTCQCHRRNGRLPCNRSANKRRLRCKLRRLISPFVNAKLLCQRSKRSQHR